MSKERRIELARQGGITAHRLGKAHKWRTFEEASEAGKKGGAIGGRISRRGPSKKHVV